MGKVFCFLHVKLIISFPSLWGNPLQGIINILFPFPRINPGVIYSKALQAFIRFNLKLLPHFPVRYGGFFLMIVNGNYPIYMPFHPFSRKSKVFCW